MEKKNVTYEVCPHCVNEVVLPDTLGVYVCPECGKYIVNCSMCQACDDLNGDKYCTWCCLCYHADTLNKEMTIDTFKAILKSKGLFYPLNSIKYVGSNGQGEAVSICLNDDETIISIGYFTDEGYFFIDDIDIHRFLADKIVDDVVKSLKAFNDSVSLK